MIFYLFMVLLFTSSGRLDAVEIVGPFVDPSLCSQARDERIESNEDVVLASSWMRKISACIEVDSALPRCE